MRPDVYRDYETGQDETILPGKPINALITGLTSLQRQDICIIMRECGTRAFGSLPFEKLGF